MLQPLDDSNPSAEGLPATGRLALHWTGKEHRARPEPRLLVEDAEHGEPTSEGWNNRLIVGDNLLALKALEREFRGSVRCALIDPPYNTGSAFAQYDDGVEHSLWLSFMRDRLEAIRPLLAPGGTIWITVDDNEAHYCKVLCDEVFGRRNFVANVVWQKRTSPDARLSLGGAHDHILVYAREAKHACFNPLPLSPDQTDAYRNPDGDPRGPWASTDFTAQGWRPNQMYPIASPSGLVFEPPPGRCWANVEEAFRALLADRRIWFGKKGDARPRVKNFLSEAAGIRAWSWWPHAEAGHNQEAKKESIALFGAAQAFATPKPERLMRRVLEIATDPGDLVLDCFAGSGTTGAVAHKMGRRWIMAENGAHALTHIVPRLRKVVRGEDLGGMTQSVGWQGGGGFRMFRIAPSLFERDGVGRLVLSRRLDEEQCRAALCLLYGFAYAPDPAEPWRHGQTGERSLVHVALKPLALGALAWLSEAAGPNRHLTVLAPAFAGQAGTFENLDICKVPRDRLPHHDWGQDCYDLPVPEDRMAGIASAA